MENQVESLTEQEVEAVSGGIAPLVVYAGGVVIGFALAAAADYLNGGFND